MLSGIELVVCLGITCALYTCAQSIVALAGAGIGIRIKGDVLCILSTLTV